MERFKQQGLKQFFKDFDKYCIGIKTADGRKQCIRGWYIDKRFSHDECPHDYNMYEFREDDEDEYNYIAFIEPFVLVNHSGTFVTRQRIPFNENGNGSYFRVRYGHEY